MPATKLLTLALLVAFAVIDGSAVRIRELRVPAVIFYGETVTFSCIYELDGPDDVLFSVKWYKDRVEFFRYVVPDSPKKLPFPRKGLNVDVEASDEQSVTIGPITMESAGEYSCEVSLDAPAFILVSSRRNVSVVVAPRQQPNITRVEPGYDPDDVIDANCTSAPSTPTAKIRWLVNGVEADENLLQRPAEPIIDVYTDPPQPISTWLAISVRATKKLFGHRDRLELSCEAQVLTLPPLTRMAKVRLWQPTAVPDTEATVGSIERANDRLAQRSSPMKSGSADTKTTSTTLFASIATAIATRLLV